MYINESLMGFEDRNHRRERLIRSMIMLAVVVLGAGLFTNFVIGYFRSQDPIYTVYQRSNSRDISIVHPDKSYPRW